MERIFQSNRFRPIYLKFKTPSLGFFYVPNYLCLMEKIKLTEQDLTNIVKRIISEDEKPKKKLFVPRNIDEREIEYQKIIAGEVEKIKKSPFGSLSKDTLFEWVQENNLDQELKLSYKGPSLGEVSMTSYDKSIGEVTLFLDSKITSLGMVGIRFKISDIQIGYVEPNEMEDDKFYPID